MFCVRLCEVVVTVGGESLRIQLAVFIGTKDAVRYSRGGP